jgi:hypothetical protein
MNETLLEIDSAKEYFNTINKKLLSRRQVEVCYTENPNDEKTNMFIVVDGDL